MVFYEDLKEDVTRELSSVIDFLHMTRKYLICAEEQQQGNFLRKKSKITDYRRFFDKDMTATIDDYLWKVYKMAFARQAGQSSHS